MTQTHHYTSHYNTELDINNPVTPTSINFGFHLTPKQHKLLKHLISAFVDGCDTCPPAIIDKIEQLANQQGCYYILLTAIIGGTQYIPKSKRTLYITASDSYFWKLTGQTIDYINSDITTEHIDTANIDQHIAQHITDNIITNTWTSYRRHERLQLLTEALPYYRIATQSLLLVMYDTENILIDAHMNLIAKNMNT